MEICGAGGLHHLCAYTFDTFLHLVIFYHFEIHILNCEPKYISNLLKLSDHLCPIPTIAISQLQTTYQTLHIDVYAINKD